MIINVKLRKATFKHIESELYAYQDTLKEIKNLRMEIITGNKPPDENVGAGANSVRNPGRPTEQIATQLLTHKTLRNLEEITGAIEYAYNALSRDHQRLVETKYWSRKKLNWDDVAIQLNMHRNTALKLRKDVVMLIANKIGWM